MTARQLTLLFSLLGLLLAIAVVVLLLAPWRDRPPAQPSGIKAVRLGMTWMQVEAVIGKPHWISGSVNNRWHVEYR